MKQHPDPRLVSMRTALILGAIALGGLNLAADYPSTVMSHSPVGYWRLNETAPSPALNIVANSGSLGSAGDGYVVLDVGKGQPGKVGNAIRLVNSATDTAYSGSKVDVPYHADLNPETPFTVEFWAKPNAFAGYDATGCAPISNFDPNWYGGGNRSGWLFYLSNAGKWTFRMGLTSGYALVLDAAPAANATPGTWQHIVATCSGTTARIYVDGVLRGTGTVAAGWKPNPQMALRFGSTPLNGSGSDGPGSSASGISGNRGYDGWLDEVAIYPTELSPETIQQHFDAGNSNPSGYTTLIQASQPVGYWAMEEPAVTAPDPVTFPVVVNSGSAGNEANGTVHWGALTDQPGTGAAGFGAGDRAVVFNGETGYIEVGDAASLAISGNITMMAWVKPRSQDFFRNILAHGWDSSAVPDYNETALRISRGGNASDGYYGTDNFYEAFSSDGDFYTAARYPIPPGDIGNWVFLAATYNGSQWNLYRNGVLVTSAQTSIGAQPVAMPWAIGSRSTPSEIEGHFFSGSIDEPAILDKALSESEIAALYQAAELAPVITQGLQVPTESVFKGSPMEFSVWAEGSGTLTYSWTSNGVPLSVTATNLVIDSIGTGAQSFVVTVTNPFGSTTSTSSFNVVAAPPSITKQPQSITRYAGSPFSFSVEVSGSAPLSYQWKRGGTPIDGATSSTYSETASASAAADYTVTVSNEAGSQDSQAASLTVLSPPAGYAGAVLASSPIAFWRLGETSGTKAGDYAGGHDGVYNNVTLGQLGSSAFDPDTAAGFSGTQDSYVGSISGAADGTGINFSGHVNFSIELFAKGSSTQIEEATLIAKGAGNSGTVAAEQFAIDVSTGKYRFFTRDSGDAFIQALAAVGPDGSWQHIVGVYDDSNGEMIIYVNGEVSGSGTTRASGLRPSEVDVTIGSKHLGNAPAHDGQFVGDIDDLAIYDKVLTAEEIHDHYLATYGSSTPPSVTVQPQPFTTYVGLPVTLRVSAAGSVPLTYQWKKNGTAIPFAEAASLTIDPSAETDSGNYSVTIVNGVGTVTSEAVSVTVLPAPTTVVGIPNLVAHYPFEGNPQDTSGRGNHGTAMSRGGLAVSYVTDAPVGTRGLRYETDAADTANVRSGYVNLGVRDDLKFGTSDFSVVFWIRLQEDLVPKDLPFLCNAENSANNPGYTFAPAFDRAATWAWSLFSTEGGGINVYPPEAQNGMLVDLATSKNGWHHLAYSFARTGLANTYVNGRLVDSRAINLTSVATLDTAHSTSIGQDPTGDYPESGRADMDDLGIFKGALTQLEVQSIYAAGFFNGQSFENKVVEPPVVSLTRSGDSITITYTGTLQSSDTVNGTYADVSGASSPFTATAAGAAKFYRAKE